MEDTYPKDGEVWKNLKGIGLKPNGTGCLASTDLYPNWSVSTMPTADPAVARKAAEALLAMPKAEGGMGWSIATDSTKTDELFKDLQIGPFGFLKDWFSKEFRTRYAGWLLLGIGLFASSLLLSFILGQIVRKRTRSLTESLKKQNELRRKEKAVSEKLSALERLGVVDQLSSIVVHELRQPLTTIRAFLFGAKKKAEKGVLSSEEALTVFEKSKLSPIVLKESWTMCVSTQSRRQESMKVLALGCSGFRTKGFQRLGLLFGGSKGGCQ